MGNKICGCLEVRRVTDCVEGGFSECIVAFEIWALGVGVKIRVGLNVHRAADCVEGGSFRASRLGVHRRW